MPKGRSVADVTTLQMALVGYQYEKQKIEERIREIEAQLKGKHVASTSSTNEKKSAGVKRVLSPAARKRIAAAQKKRWAEHRKRIASQSKGE
jgi:cell division septum initiation protein DivIVA